MLADFADLVDRMRDGHGRTGSEPAPLLEAPFDVAVVSRALALANRAHRGQLRADHTNYLAHPVRVARLAAAWDPRPHQDIVVAALLHDVVEDSDTTLTEITERFGTGVAAIVDAVSTAKPPPGETREQRRTRKLAKVAGLDKAETGTLVVHACDVLDNTISWRYLRPVDAAWTKIPRWMFQVDQYQLGLLDSQYPRIAGLLREELQFQEARGLAAASWDSP